MATTLAKLGASPYALRYTLLGDTLDEIASRTAAQVIADAAEGPLKAKLQQANALGDTIWNAIGHTDFSVSAVSGGANGLTTGATALGVASFEALSPGTRTLNFKVSKTGALPCVIEIRYNHTLNR